MRAPGPLSPAVGPGSQRGRAAGGAERPSGRAPADPGAVPRPLRSRRSTTSADAPGRGRRAVRARSSEALQAVESLDADRVLRRLAALVRASTRTNYYQAAPTAGPSPTSASSSPRRRARGPARAEAVPRDLRRRPARRGGAPALRPGGPRRHPLVGPARRLPHRGAGPGQGAERQERRHRAGGLEGRLLSQATPHGGSADAIRAEAVRA